MILRLLILIGLVLAGCAALFYLVSRVHRFRFSLALARGRRRLRRWVAPDAGANR